MATVNRYTAAPIGSYKKRRVAAYARVSTDHEEQQSSYEAQVDYYTNYINGREDWEFVSVYADDGWSCGNFDCPEFKRMMGDVEAGRVNCVVVKDLGGMAFSERMFVTLTYH